MSFISNKEMLEKEFKEVAKTLDDCTVTVKRSGESLKRTTNILNENTLKLKEIHDITAREGEKLKRVLTIVSYTK